MQAYRPLTLEELRAMLGRQIWLATPRATAQVTLQDITSTPVETFWFSGQDVGLTVINYGQSWIPLEAVQE